MIRHLRSGLSAARLVSLGGGRGCCRLDRGTTPPVPARAWRCDRWWREVRRCATTIVAVIIGDLLRGGLGADPDPCHAVEPDRSADAPGQRSDDGPLRRAHAARHGRGRLGLSDLAAAILLSPSGLSKLVDRMAAAGLLRREPDPADARSTFATITPHGRRAVRKARLSHHDWLDRVFGGALDDRDVTDLTRIMSQIHARTPHTTQVRGSTGAQARPARRPPCPSQTSPRATSRTTPKSRSRQRAARSKTPVPEPSGRVSGLFGSQSDVDQRRRLVPGGTSVDE